MLTPTPGFNPAMLARPQVFPLRAVPGVRPPVPQVNAMQTAGGATLPSLQEQAQRQSLVGGAKVAELFGPRISAAGEGNFTVRKRPYFSDSFDDSDEFTRKARRLTRHKTLDIGTSGTKSGSWFGDTVRQTGWQLMLPPGVQAALGLRAITRQAGKAVSEVSKASRDPASVVDAIVRTNPALYAGMTALNGARGLVGLLGKRAEAPAQPSSWYTAPFRAGANALYNFGKGTKALATGLPAGVVGLVAGAERYKQKAVDKVLNFAGVKNPPAWLQPTKPLIAELENRADGLQTAAWNDLKDATGFGAKGSWSGKSRTSQVDNFFDQQRKELEATGQTGLATGMDVAKGVSQFAGEFALPVAGPAALAVKGMRSIPGVSRVAAKLPGWVNAGLDMAGFGAANAALDSAASAALSDAPTGQPHGAPAVASVLPGTGGKAPVPQSTPLGSNAAAAVTQQPEVQAVAAKNPAVQAQIKQDLPFVTNAINSVTGFVKNTVGPVSKEVMAKGQATGDWLKQNLAQLNRAHNGDYIGALLGKFSPGLAESWSSLSPTQKWLFGIGGGLGIIGLIMAASGKPAAGAATAGAGLISGGLAAYGDKLAPGLFGRQPAAAPAAPEMAAPVVPVAQGGGTSAPQTLQGGFANANQQFVQK